MSDRRRSIRELEAKIERLTKMKTYIVKSFTNYGEVVHIVNAENLDDLSTIVSADDTIWDNPNIEELDMSVHGVVAIGGGDGG